jgi:hypothetical protein
VDLKTLALKWQVSEANANPPAWQDAGISTNTMYVSFGDPGDAIRTVLDVGTRNAKGLSTTSQIGSQIWSDFIDRSVKTWDGYELHYWGSVASSGSTVYDPNPSGDNNVAGLLRLKDGRCGAWAQFFVDVWAAQDVIAHVWSINPISNFYPAPAGFPNFDGFVVNAMPGQGNANPARAFFDHAVVKFDNVPAVYDPSYGKYYANDQAWRDAAESEFQFRDTFNILPNTQYQGVAHAPKAIDSTFTKI